jgi:hypothetical protein
MAYNRFSLGELRNLVKERFYRKNLERDARAVKLNVSANAFRQILEDADRNPVLSNKVFTERKNQQNELRGFKEAIAYKKRQQEQKQLIYQEVKSDKIKKLVARLATDPVRSFNELQDLNYDFTESDVNRLFQNVNGRYVIEIFFLNGEEASFTLTRENVSRLRSMIVHKIHFLLGNTYGSDKLSAYNDEPIERFRIIKLNDAQYIPVVKPLQSDSTRGIFTPLDLQQSLFREHNRFGGFFAYKNKSNIDLTNYQIYKESTKTVEGVTFNSRNIKEMKEENECCLLFALKKNGVTEEQIKHVMAILGSLQSNIPLSKMEIVAQVIQTKLTLHYYDEAHKRTRKGDKKSHMYGREFEKSIDLAMFKNHFFYLEDTKYTEFYIRNMNEIEEYCKDKPKMKEHKFNFNRRQGKYFVSQNVKFMNSLELVVCLMDVGLFSEYHVDLTEYASENYVIEPSLTNVEHNQEDFQEKLERKEESKQKRNEGKLPPIYLFADCESDVTGKKHEMIAFGFCDMEEKYEVVTYPSKVADETDEEQQKRFINLIKCRVTSFLVERGFVKGNGKEFQNREVNMFFHNMKYDATLFNDLFYSSEECCKDGQLYSKSYNFDFGVKIEFRDSLKHFGGKLNEASDTFDLGISKGEAIGYTFHTKNNIWKNDLVSCDKYLKHVKPEDHHIFKQNVKEDKFTPTKYYLEYLNQDVIVLCKAMKKYKQLIYDITGLNAFDFLTISSIGYQYAIKEGCFNGLYSVSGCLREFIQRSVKGGRVYVNEDFRKKEITDAKSMRQFYENEFIKKHGEHVQNPSEPKFNEEDDRIEDFDGVSLYPSAMKRLCEEYGLPMGTIKKGLEKTYEYYESKDWYVVKVLITKINKKIQIPCVSINDGESLKYLNEISESIELYVDKTTLNDYIKFQEIEYQILEGVYWDQGFNKRIGEVIEKLHNDRCLYKKTNKPLATMIKLIMNSIYGKTGQRMSETKTEFVSNAKKDQYIYDHFGVISEIQTNKFNTKITKRVCDNDSSLNFVASSILSMSKRIMNEVFSVMDDNKQPVFYTDTDSIHMLQKDVKVLGESYKDTFNRDLIGKNLGQFHTDFDMDGCTNVYSIKHIPIAPKTYLDILQGTNVQGETVYDTHIRIKGIKKAGIDYELTQRGPNKIKSAISLFRDLAQDKEVTFYLNPTDHDVSFEFNGSGVLTRKTKSFMRVLNKVEPK